MTSSPHNSLPPACAFCRRDISRTHFGATFGASGRSIDACAPCAQSVYSSVALDLVAGILALRREVDALTSTMNDFSRSPTWQRMLRESRSSTRQSPLSSPRKSTIRELEKRQDAYLRAWGKKIRPLEKKRHKLLRELEHFKERMRRKRAEILRRGK